MSYKYCNSFLDSVTHGDSVFVPTFQRFDLPFFSNECDEFFNAFDEFLNDFEGIFSPSLERFLQPLTN